MLISTVFIIRARGALSRFNLLTISFSDNVTSNNNNIDTSFISKLPLHLKPKYILQSNTAAADDDEKLHAHWKSLENRLLHRKHVKRVDVTKGSRSSLNTTAWDAGDNGYSELYNNTSVTND